jgi:hypothetical protein
MAKHSVKKNRLRLAIVVFILVPLLCCKSIGVENLGIFGETRKQSILGQDGCTPIPLDGKVMWTFGDTILGTWKGELSVNTTFESSAVMKDMISNSLAFTEIPDDATVLNLLFQFYKKNGKVVTFIKNYPGEDPGRWRFWPVDGLQIGSTVYVFYYIILIDHGPDKNNKNPFPIRVMGTGIAEWKKPASWKVGDQVNFIRGVKLFLENEPVFGDCITRVGDELYIIGHGKPDNGKVPSYIARVGVTEIKNRKAYSFLDKNGNWSPDIKHARAFFYDIMGELSLIYNEYLKKYVIIFCGMDGKIKYVAFNDFTTLGKEAPRVLYVPPPLPQIESRPLLFYYSGKEIFHTEKGIYAIYIHPAIYQPILIRIPYSALTD